MTKKELAITYLKRAGYTEIHGEGFDPILPYILMDLVFQTYKTCILPLKLDKKLQNQTNHYVNIWEDKYHKFNKEFFEYFKDDEQDMVLDIMDEFEKYTEKDMTIAKYVAIDCFRDELSEIKTTLGNVALCNAITKIAQNIYGRVYKNKFRNSVENPYLKGIIHATEEFMNHYYRKKRYIDLNQSNNLKNSIHVICRKIVKFLNE